MTFYSTTLKRFACIVFIASALPLLSKGQNPNVGSSGAKFLQIPIGGRAASMGGAFVGIANDASSAFWNPAGLVRLQSNAVFFSSMRWFNSFDINAASIVYNGHDNGSFAASIVVLSMDKMEVTTETSPNGTGEFFDAQDMAMGLSYARYLTPQFSVGITAKYVNQRIWNEVADGIAFDIGTQYQLEFNNLIIAMSMRNFGGDLQFDGPDLNITHLKNKDYPSSRLAPGRLETDAYPMPLCFQVGVGIDLYNSEFMKVRIGLDALHPNDNSEKLNGGAEVTFYDRLFLRGGYRYGYDDENYSFGIGVSLPVELRRILFDYSYSHYIILPDVHRFSVGFEF
jgi:hypothetical protein